MRAHSNTLKPYLAAEGKRERLRWVFRSVETAAHRPRVLHDFEDFAHVDDKWHYLFKDGQTLHSHDGEIPPVREVQSKRFITEAMFLAIIL